MSTLRRRVVVRHPPRRGARIAALLAIALLGACTPTLDWRRVDVPDSGLSAELPCRPGRFQRDLVVASTRLELFMLSCEAAGVTYGVATADVGDPARVDAVLRALEQGAEQAIQARDVHAVPLRMAGATPFSANVIARLRGVRPDGVAVEESVRVFGRGTRIFQASAIAPALPDAATAPFEAGLRFAPEASVDDAK